MAELRPLIDDGAEKERALGYITELIERFPGLVDRAQRAGMNPADVRLLTETLGLLYELRVLVRAPRVSPADAAEARGLTKRIFESAERGIRALLVATAIGAGGTETAVNLHHLLKDDVVPAWEAQEGLEETVVSMWQPQGGTLRPDQPALDFTGANTVVTPLGGEVHLPDDEARLVRALIDRFPEWTPGADLRRPTGRSSGAVRRLVRKLRARLDDSDDGAGKELVLSTPAKGYVLAPKPATVDEEETQRLSGRVR